MKRLSLFVFLAAVLPSLSGQCPDPRPPRDGFFLKFLRGRRVTYSDDYKTAADVIYPNATPGRCGWPLVVFTHGLGQTRGSSGLEALRLAQLGYFVVAYDVRGQGIGLSLNPNRGSRLWALEEWIDLAEIIDWCENTFGNLVDTDRIGVYGDSQGGAHAWAAAAYSNKFLPSNSRWTKRFWKIGAVVPRFFGASFVDVVAPGGERFHWSASDLAYSKSSATLRLDSAYQARIAAFVDDDDPQAAQRFLQAIPGKDLTSELRTTAVPIFTIQGWQDPWTSTNAVLRVLEDLPATTPRRCYLTTGQHGMPVNTAQSWRQIYLTELWFRRFLKRYREPIEQGPTYLSAAMPPTTANYRSESNLWPHRADETWPPPSTTTVRYYCRNSARLRTSKPGTGENEKDVRHTVPSSFDARDFFRVGGGVSAVQQRIPRYTARFDSPRFSQVTEIGGTPTVSLFVEPEAPNYMIGARLFAVAPSGSRRLLASGVRGVRGRSIVKRQIEIELNPVASVLPAGYRVRLELNNHHIVQPTTVESFGSLPFFGSYEVDVQHREGRGFSWIDLPLRRYVQHDVASAQREISITSPGTQQLQLRSGPNWKGSFYLVFVSLSGQGRPQRLPGNLPLWLNSDPLTFGFAQAMNGPALVDFVGVLDANGAARSTLNLGVLRPLPQSLVGSSLSVASVMYDFDRQLWGTGAPVRFLFK